MIARRQNIRSLCTPGKHLEAKLSASKPKYTTNPQTHTLLVHILVARYNRVLSDHHTDLVSFLAAPTSLPPPSLAPAACVLVRAVSAFALEPAHTHIHTHISIRKGTNETCMHKRAQIINMHNHYHGFSMRYLWHSRKLNRDTKNMIPCCSTSSLCIGFIPQKHSPLWL